MMAQLKAGTASTKRGSASEPQRSAEGTRMTSKLTCDMSVGNPDTSIGDGGFSPPSPQDLPFGGLVSLVQVLMTIHSF